jgi:Flp pilus assembly protein TadD
MAGQYQQALATLGAISNQNDPMVLTMTGYSERKLGHVDVATALYFKALAVDPNNVDTHEYLGEGYAASGRIDLAKAELATVQDLCGNTTCEQYEDLSDAIASNPS